LLELTHPPLRTFESEVGRSQIIAAFEEPQVIAKIIMGLGSPGRPPRSPARPSPPFRASVDRDWLKQIFGGRYGPSCARASSRMRLDIDDFNS
jgi:hypothetical protein